MVSVINTTSAIRRLAIFASCFILTFLFLRHLRRTYSDHFFPSPPSTIGPSWNQPSRNRHSSGSGNETTYVPPRARLTLEYQEYLTWNPPLEITNHYPSYGDYFKKDYDPNRWEDFDQNNDIFKNSTMSGRSSDAPPKPYSPYPDYNSEEWRKHWRGGYVPCDGPGGKPYQQSHNEVVTAYDGVPVGFPIPDSGSHEALELDTSVCFDRFGRLTPYGFPTNGFVNDFTGVQWGKLQKDCVARNQDRFRDPEPPDMGRPQSQPDPQANNQPEKPLDTRSIDDLNGRSSLDDNESHSTSPSHHPRTAVLIRAWDDYEYQENDIMAIRSLITELSLLSGGEYQVFLFVQIKDASVPLFTDQKVYDETMQKYIPKELQDITVLWTEALCYSWYPLVGEWSVNFQQFMPVQWFSKLHPQFDYIWNWEMDARYIGNHYHLLEQVRKFARKQPRKYLWERNSRYYFPAVHGTYENFTQNTNRIVAENEYLASVWGPQPWKEDQKPQGPNPPHSEEEDKFEWGVDEEADFITLLPMWDPRQTFWSYRDKLWGYSYTENSTDKRPYPDVPRRTFINTVVRFSARLLETMHDENRAGHSMVSELWPSSIALQHGYKAVYAPHPIWFAHLWPTEYMENVFNADGWGAGSGRGTTDDGRGLAYDPERESQGLSQKGTGPNGEGMLGRWGQERDSPYSPDREHNFAGWSWYFWSDFPKVIYWRWLGWKTSFNFVTIQGVQSNDELGTVDWEEWEKEKGRMCLPAMLLHPVKKVVPPKGTKYYDAG